ncbi:hypothetical protein [Bradyrhizobium hipponense]|uniref:hypothetical protein n=1 Tax=Bradyrhizobium hipponense TaxID=2605638 RepID=UPI001F1605AD|nr:hypothetical protein [Bradyrhizobium hipponense]
MWLAAPAIPSTTSLRDLLSREIKTGELLRALIVVGPMVAALFRLARNGPAESQ